MEATRQAAIHLKYEWYGRYAQTSDRKESVAADEGTTALPWVFSDRNAQ
jgi:hypothetical protein